MSGIRNRGAEIHCTGPILHGIVEKRELTDNRITQVIRKTHLSLKPALVHLLLDGCQIILRDGEVGIDWV